MSDTGKGIGEKLVEMGVSSMKAGANEIKTSVTTAAGQITGQPVKSDQELKQIAIQDKDSSDQRINEIQNELAQQKMSRFREVSGWHSATAAKTIEEHQQEQSIPKSTAPLAGSQTQRKGTPEPVRQAVGNKELGRNFKG